MSAAPPAGSPAGGAAPGERIARLSSLYAALSKTNEAIFREPDPLKLCRAVCEIAVAHGGLVSASVRLYDAPARTLRFFCGHGPLEGHIGARDIALDDPTSRAAAVARERAPYFRTDVQSDPLAAHGRADAGRIGVRSSGGLPLTAGDELVGVLSVYAGPAGYFDAEIASLLSEMARNLSFAFAKQRSDAARARSEAHYRTLFDAAPDGIRVVCEGRVVMINEAGARLFGHGGPARMIGREVAQTIAPEYRDYAMERIAAAARGQAAPASQQTLLRPDGGRVDVEVVSMPFDYEGRPATLSILRDLTARRASERRILRLANLYNALSRTNEAMLRITGIEKLCQSVCEIAVTHGGLVSAAIRAYNPARGVLEPYCGYGPREGRLGNDVIDLDTLDSNAARVAREGGRYVVNDMTIDPSAVLSRETAARLGVAASAGFALNIDGELAGVFSVFAAEPGFFDDELTGLLDEMARNLSFAFAKKRGESTLARAEERYRQLFDATPVAVFVIFEGRVVMFNPATATLMRLGPTGQFLGRRVEDLVSPEARAEALERLRVITTERRGVPMIECAVLRADGSEVEAEVIALPFDYEGQPAALYILHDLTERRAAERASREHAAELEEQVQRRTAELKRALADLESFSYTVAHDLRAPLRRMHGFAGLLRESLGPTLGEEDRNFLERVTEGALAMDRLIEALLELAQLGRAEPRVETVDLSGEVEALAANLKQREPQRAVAFVIAPGLSARADRRLIRAVLDNLIGNAWKFTSRHPQARIEFGAVTEETAAGPARERVYYVRDDGAGFDEHYAGKLFGTFQRLHPQSEFPGTGIGLASVKRIIGSHGGRVWAHGAVDEGATFYFSLPLER